MPTKGEQEGGCQLSEHWMRRILASDPLGRGGSAGTPSLGGRQALVLHMTAGR